MAAARGGELRPAQRRPRRRLEGPLDPRPDNGKQERARAQLGRRCRGPGLAARGGTDAGVEVPRELGGQALGEIVDDGAAAELGERAREREADLHVDARTTLGRCGEGELDLAARLRAARAVAAAAAHHPSVLRIVPVDVSLAGE